MRKERFKNERRNNGTRRQEQPQEGGHDTKKEEGFKDERKNSKNMSKEGCNVQTMGKKKSLEMQMISVLLLSLLLSLSLSY